MSEDTIPTTPSYVDNQSLCPSFDISCLNLKVASVPRAYTYVDDDLGFGAVHSESSTPDGEHSGSSTHVAANEGNLTIQLDAYNDPIPLPTYIMTIRNLYYVISGKVGNKREKAKVVRVTLPLKKCVAPVLANLLSEKGQYIEVSTVANAAMTAINAAAVNTRAGATVVYSAESLPTGVTISSSTGSITGTPTAAGVSNIKVTCTDTLDGKSFKGIAWIKLTVTAS
ncbi:MAG: Ig domain-containing protein [Opitutaceae bacterium]|jgi:hypothetical protein